nr:MAG TPA: hypothetical protein [Caudoviricetes sp.]
MPQSYKIHIPKFGIWVSRKSVSNISIILKGKNHISKIYLFKNVYIHYVHIYMRSFPFMQSKLHSSASLSALSFPASWKGPFTHAQPANQTNIPSWRFVHG